MKLARIYAPLAIALTSLVGCSGGESVTDKDGGVDSGPPPNEIRFDTTSYTLQPGEEKRYYCFTTRLPADKPTIAEEITPIYGKATHHLAIYYTIQAEPDGAFDCPQLVKNTWLPLYVGGVASGSLKAPPGAGFHLFKNQQLLVQLHLLNAGAAPVEDKATIVLKTTDNTNAVPAGIYGFDYRGLNIPAQSQGVIQGMSCPNMPWDMDVFAVLGHMHQLGKNIDVSRGAQPGDEMLYQAAWNFDDQPTVPKSLKIKTGDNIHLRCTYDNPGAMDVTYGESSFQEMCAFVFYYTPFKLVNGCTQP